MTTSDDPTGPTPFGSALRRLRLRAGWSQVDLAAVAGTTPRHVSFIETGRSRPGRDLVERLSDALDLAPRDRDDLFTAAGLASPVTHRRLDHAELQAHRAAIDQLLAGHEPFPASAMDTHGVVLALNRTCHRLHPGIERLGAEELIDAALASEQARSGVRNFAEVAHAYVDRIERRARTSNDPILHQLLARARRHLDGVPRPAGDGRQPTLTIHLSAPDGTELALFATIVRFEHPVDITLAEVWVELLFPADEPTRRWFTTGNVAPPTGGTPGDAASGDGADGSGSAGPAVIWRPAPADGPAASD